MSWLENIPEEHRETFSSFESQDQLFETIGYTPEVKEVEKVVEKEVDWRSGLDEDLRKTADRFNSTEDLIRAVQDYRKKDSLVRVPGKNATEDEISAYKKAIGVPDSIEGYEFPEVEDEDFKSSAETWGNKLLELNVPKETAKELMNFIVEQGQTAQNSLNEADKKFADEQTQLLQNEWKGDYDQNMTHANRAFKELADRAGLNMEDLKSIETKDGRFLMDRAEILRMFATVGREMAEGTLGPALSPDEQDTVQDQIRTLRDQQREAQERGENRRADELYLKEQQLLAKLENKPIVGSHGRAA